MALSSLFARRRGRGATNVALHSVGRDRDARVFVGDRSGASSCDETRGRDCVRDRDGVIETSIGDETERDDLQSKTSVLNTVMHAHAVFDMSFGQMDLSCRLDFGHVFSVKPG